MTTSVLLFVFLFRYPKNWYQSLNSVSARKESLKNSPTSLPRFLNCSCSATPGTSLSIGGRLFVTPEHDRIEDLESDADNRIVGTAVRVKRETGKSVTVLTTDTNMRTVSRAHGLRAEWPGGGSVVDKNDGMGKIKGGGKEVADTLLPIKQVSELTGLPEDIINGWIRSGKVRAENGMVDITTLPIRRKGTHMESRRPIMKKRLMTIKQAAELTGIPEDILNGWVRSGLWEEENGLVDINSIPVITKQERPGLLKSIGELDYEKDDRYLPFDGPCNDYLYGDHIYYMNVVMLGTWGDDE